MIRSALSLNPACLAATGRSPRRLPPLPSSHLARDANGKATAVAITHVKAHSTAGTPSQRRKSQQGAASTAHAHLSNPPTMRQHHSLELALEEADGGFYSEQQLRRANVSPFFSSAKAPDAVATSLSELELPSPRNASRRTNYEGYSSSGRNLQTLVIPPLSLDFDDSYTDTKSLSRSPSWQDLELLPDSAPAQRVRGRSPKAHETYGSYEDKVSSSASADAWDVFLSEHSTTNTERVSVAHAMKTPTAETTPPFQGFFTYLVCKEDPKAFSPTNIDKKVLVTESDLKLPSYPFDSFGEPVFRSLDMGDGYDWDSNRHDAVVPHNRHKASMPSTSSTSRSKREKLFPREALVKETQARPTKRAKLQPLAYRCKPLSPAPPVKVSSSRHGRPIRPNDSFRRAESGQYVLNVHRLPELISDSLPHYTPRDQYTFPAMDSHWKRTPPQEPTGKPPNHQTQRVARERRLMTAPQPQQLDSHHELLYLPGIFPDANYARSPRLPKPARRKIGIYGPEARRERLRRFHEKRKQRVFHKRIKYDCRKRLANACPRIKGRFVRKEDLDEAKQSSPTATSHSQSPSGSDAEDDSIVATVFDASIELAGSSSECCAPDMSA